MLKLEEIKKDLQLVGVEPNRVVRVLATDWGGLESLSLVYRRDDGTLGDRMLFRSDEEQLAIATTGRPWAFDAPSAAFKLVTEAYRINLAHLFDPMMAVHTSNVEPLPHQITAVYESMLPCQPLRFVLADDPGAGKTIMAGLLIRELLMRADARRVLVISPGSLVEQWQEELWEKFGLRFEIFFGSAGDAPAGTNPFTKSDLWIARLDQLSRSQEYQQFLRSTQWDLAIVDEAHKCAAHWVGKETKRTKRFSLIQEIILPTIRHLLLMTATPHNGKEEDFQLFLSLLDPERFYGRFRDRARKVDVSDLMRRMVKEQLVKFNGKPLFPERRAYTVTYQLSDLETALYEAVTDYVKEEMRKIDRLPDENRRGTVGFALTTLQRRLASSPAAIYESLRRRRVKLKERLDEEKRRQRSGRLSSLFSVRDAPDDLTEAEDELPDEEYEQFQQQIVDQASAAQTLQELEAEIAVLTDLEKQARAVVRSERDRKWEELSKLLQNTPEMHDDQGQQRKLIVFTEHRDTLTYLSDKIRGVLGSPDTVVVIHGGIKREERLKTQERFRNEPEVRVLVATDAAGEGVNLQNANLMVNYDLPWNPNRLEQRFGRIHRIGQTEVCHLWNMVAAGTREGDVFQRLFEKLEVERKALGGRVFDILGEIFEEKSLRDLLIEAIRYGNDPTVRAQLEQQVEGALDTDHLRAIMNRNALAEEVLSPERVFAVREQMEKAEARKLQPYFVRAFFEQAFATLDGELRPRESGRYEITHVPAQIRERDRMLSNRDRRHNNPVVTHYERVCFEKPYVRVPFKPMASLLHPAHPLLQAVTSLVLEQHSATLKQGTIFVDPNDLTVTPRVLLLIDHSIKEGDAKTQTVISRRLQFVEVTPQGTVTNAGWAPHLDLEPPNPDNVALIHDLLLAPWLSGELEKIGLTYAAEKLAPDHFMEVKERREGMIGKTLQAVHERLWKEINFWSGRLIQTQEEVSVGRQPSMNIDNVKRMIDELTARLNTRRSELEVMRHIISATPIVVGGALVIPQGLLNQRRGMAEFTTDAVQRSIIEQRAMKAVMDAERALGHAVIDVSEEKCGWDITAIPPANGDMLPPLRHIEVKGRVKGASTITVTRNEMLYGLNQAEKFLLAIVLIDGDHYEGPFYVRNPFSQEPGWAVTSINLDLDQLLAKAERSL